MRAVHLASVLLLASFPVSATSYVPMTDAALVAEAPVIAVVEVQGSGGGLEGVRPYTAYRVRVGKVLKGALAPGLAITVRVPGGKGADGLNLRIWGAPRFAEGEKALLFLSPRLDGSYSIVHLMLGAFHEVGSGGRRLAMRHLSEAQAIVQPGELLPVEPRRDFDRFVSWIDSRVRGLRVRADYDVAALPGLDPVTEAFTLFEDPETGYNLRWFEFDDDESVEWLAHQAGQVGVAGGGFAEFQTAIAAWNDDPGTNIDYTYGGTTTDTTGFTGYDELNTIVFNDPNNEIPGFFCSGGILAIGGPWYYSETTDWQGTPYHRIANADIVVNNGLTCFFEDSPDASAVAEELFAHELGHTLGLNHSEEPEALMRPYIHDDGRGALLHADERAAIASLYGPASVPTDFFTLTPCRLIDTRGATDSPSLQSEELRTFAVAGRCGIPSTAVSISINITVQVPSGTGRLTLFPADRAEPSTSSVNFPGGKTVANNAILLLSGTPEKSFTVAPMVLDSGTAHLLVDVNGYFE